MLKNVFGSLNQELPAVLGSEGNVGGAVHPSGRGILSLKMALHGGNKKQTDL